MSASTKTEYAEKLLDTVELVMLNKPLAEQSPAELRLSTVCLSIVSDLVEVNQILEHQLTQSIMTKKYS